MSELATHKNVSVVHAILPQHIANAVIDAVFAVGDRTTFLLNARGTLVRERWYQALLPVMSPEKEYLQFLVPDPEVAHVLETIVDAGELHLPGAGAVFSVPCEEFTCSSEFALWESSAWEGDAFNASRNFRENLTAIFCIVQPDQTDQIARAAMAAGAHGPVVFYCEGHGLRDRLGWLRITKKRNKEVMLIVVDNADAVAVTEAMIEAGDIDLPGRGFLFRVPIQSGLVNIGSTVGARRYAASMQQIIAAIDDLQGNTTWRDQRVSQLMGQGNSAGLRLFGKVRERTYLNGQMLLTCIVARRHAAKMVDHAIAAGAPGANISYAKMFEADDDDGRAGVRLHRERALIRFVIAESARADLTAALAAAAASEEIKDICLYAQPVTRAITYVPENPAVAMSPPG